MPSSLIQAGRIARRVPFTLVMVAVLTVIGLITHTILADITPAWNRQLGFAPRDFWLLSWGRIVSSALVTSGGIQFWAAVIMIVVAVGGAEWLSGTLRTALTFWGGHLVALIFESILVVLPLEDLGFTDVQGMYIARDVGPSAGFVCCLGLLSARLPGRWRWISGITIQTALLILPFLPPPAGRARIIYLSSALAHLLAFPLGWLSSRIAHHAHRDLPTRAETIPD